MFGLRPSPGQPEFRTRAEPANIAKNSRIHSSIFAEEIAVRVHLLEFSMDLFSRRCRATVLAVSRIDGLIGTLERGPDLIAPLDGYLFRIIKTKRVGGTTAVSYVSNRNRPIIYLCATKYDKPSGAYGLNEAANLGGGSRMEY